ncbi:MAG: hypothetical protein K0R71_131 [Bacillales bacterium]|nr:hypothetical protein [Bacillales bacterium]
MKFKHIFLKIKNSMFLIILFIIGIGIFVIVNLPDDESTGIKKNTEKIKSIDVQKENEQVEEDNDFEKNNSKVLDVDKVVPKPSKEYYGLIDGVEYKNNFHGRAEVYQNPFFGMKVHFPKGWIIGDPPEVSTLIPFEKNKNYLFNAYVDNKYLLGVTAEKFEVGSKKFLEDVVKTDYISLIGPEINGRIVESPIQTSDVEVIKVNNYELNYFDVKDMGDYFQSHYALELVDTILHFQIRSFRSKEETHNAFAKLIENITFE